MNWVVQDSDEEGVICDHPKRNLQTHSSISEFNPTEIPLASEDKLSMISDFTAGNGTKRADTTSDSITDASVVVVTEPKPKRPKPRPAYGRVLPLDKSLAGIDFSFASMIANATNQSSPGSSNGTVLGTNSSLISSDRANAHKRSATTGDMDSRRGTPVFCDSTIHSDFAAEGSSKSLTSPGNGQHHRSVPPTSEARRQAHESSSSSRGPRSPSAHSEVNQFDGIPSSPPFQPRKRKREIIDLDSDVDDFIQASYEARSGAKVKEKKTKEKNARKNKAKVQKEDGDASIITPSSGKTTKRNSRAKDKAPEPEFKSKEYIEDSDDELLLEPETSKSILRASHSVPASADASVDISFGAFGQTTNAMASNSVLPSPSVTAQPSAAVSEPPSIGVSAPPLSPSGLVTSSSDKSNIKRRKKRTKTLRRGEQGEPEETETLQHVSGKNAGERHRTGGDERRDKVGKSVEPPDSLHESGKRYTAEPSGSAEKDEPEGKDSRKRRQKKRAAVLSSDEEEPEFIAIHDKPDEMEGDRTKSAQDRISDKENEHSNSPGGRLDETVSSRTDHAAQIEAISSRAQTTPKLSSRRDSMSAIIRRASAKIQSPLCSPSPVYSPLSKASRTALGRIAPLHPNRRTPPPPPPRPPAPKKSKKLLELEEKWEEELAESVDGWACMTDEERAALRRVKRDEYFGFED